MSLSIQNQMMVLQNLLTCQIIIPLPTFMAQNLMFNCLVQDHTKLLPK